MNILYLVPNFPPNYYHFCEQLKRAGATVVGISWESYNRLRPELKESLADYCQVPDTSYYDHVLKACAYLISRVGKLDRIVSQEEHWIDLEAALRQDFNVPGKKPEEIRFSRQKSLMKQVFTNAGVPTARGELAETPEAARRFAEKTGYPIIAKPDKGVGAAGTYKINDEKQLDAFFASKNLETSYLLEDFLEGFIVSFDGLTDRDGNIVFCTAHQYLMDVMTAVNTDDHMAYWSLRDIPPDLEDLGRKAVKAFDVREKFFHLEFFRGPNGKLTAMEANIRPPGGLTTDMFNFANDINVYKAWAEIVVHGKTELSYERPYHVCYIGRKTHKRYAHSHEQVLQKYGSSFLFHGPIDSIFRQAIGDYAYLVRSKTLEDIWPVMEFIHKQEN